MEVQSRRCMIGNAPPLLGGANIVASKRKPGNNDLNNRSAHYGSEKGVGMVVIINKNKVWIKAD